MKPQGSLEKVIRRIVFVEFKNHAFSQMAEAYCKTIICKEYIVSSGGFMPAIAIHPLIYKVMEEVNIPLDGHYPKMVPSEWWDNAYRIIFLGTDPQKEHIPFMPGAEDISLWKVPKVEECTPVDLRRERDILFQKVQKFVADLPCHCHTRKET